MKNRLSFIALGFLTACATVVQRVNYDHAVRITQDSSPVYFTSPAVRGALPHGGDAGLILLPVSFNGKKSVCLMDTGSPISILYSNPVFAELPYGGNMWVEGLSGGGSAAEMREVARLEIGGVGIAGAKLLYSDSKVGHLYNCLIGMDVLSHGIISLDFSRREFRWLKEFPKEVSPQPLTMTATGRMILPFKVAGNSLFAFFDTGASITIISPDFIHAHKSDFQLLGHFEDGFDIFGHRFKYDVYRSSQLEFAGTPMSGNIASFDANSAVNDKRDALVGYNLIRKANWLLDAKNRIWANF